MKKSYFKQLLSVILTLLIVINLVILPIGVSAEEEVQIQYSGKYNAAEYIKAQVDKHTAGSATYYPTDAVWTMETTAIPTDTTSYITDSTEWTTASLKMEGNPFSDTKKGEKYLKPYMYYTNEIHATDKDAIKAGIMSDGQYAGITGGARFGVISSLTFVAPQSGTVKLSDPNGGKFQWWLNHVNNIGGLAGVELGMDKYTEQDVVGFAIYKNNEKLWPSDTAYSSVTGVSSGRTIDFPEIKDIALTEGDKLRMVIIPIAASKHGYYEMNPEITYGADYIETQFNAYEAVKAKQDATTYESKEVFNDSNWSYETRNLEVDSETGYNLPTSADWTQPTLKYYSDGDDQLKEVFPSIFRNTPKGSDYGYGIVTYENKLVTTCIPLMSNASGKVASTITWTASKEGTVRLYDPDSGQIGRLPKETCITQALDSEKNRIGIAIYKNSEQIWPAVDSENSESFGGINYYMLTGDTWEGSTLVKGGRVSVDFPELNDIKVDENDKLRIMIVPLNEDFGYMTLNPQVDYTALADATYANYPLSLQIGDSGKDIKIYEVEQASYAPENIQVNLNTGSGVYPLTRDGADPALSYTMDKELSDDGSETFKISYNYGAKHFTTNFKVRVVDTVWGDMIMDGKVDASDISAMRQYLLGLSKQSWHTSLSDVNDDALVDVRDLVRIKRYLSDKQNTVIGPAVVTPLVPEENAEPKVITKIKDNSILRHNASDDYEPYLQYGVQIKPDSIGRTSAEKLEYFKKAYELGFKMVAVPVYWNSVEVAEDQYNLYQVKQIIDFANKYSLDVELLWYGSNVLGHSGYVPSYIIKDTATYPTKEGTGVFDYSHTDIFTRESAALSKVMDYIYCYDTKNAVCAVQVENEPNWNRLLDNQKDAAVSYLDRLGQVVKNSKYSVVTRVNLCNYDDSNRTFDSELAAELVATAGIDCVGGDVYTNSASTSNTFIGKFDFKGNINLTAESGGAYSRYAQMVMNSFANGRGYIAYELRTSSNSEYDFGIYRQSDTEWIERDGSKSVLKAGDPVNTYPEVKTSDILTFNHMVNKVRTQLAAAIYSGSSNFAMLSDEGADNLLSAAGSVNGFAVTYESSTDTQKYPTRADNKAGLVFQYDGYWYFFTTASRAVFTLEIYSGTMQTYNNGAWEDYVDGMEKYDDSMHFASYSDRVYRVKVAE